MSSSLSPPIRELVMGIILSRFRYPTMHQSSSVDGRHPLNSPTEPHMPQEPMPDHWRFELEWIPEHCRFLRRILLFCLKALCLVSFGHSEPNGVWEAFAAGDKWRESTARLCERTNTIVVVAGLLLGASAAFVTTNPPLVDHFNYNTRGAYLCLLISFAATLGTLIVGSTVVFVMSKCSRKWFLETHMASPSRIICTMYLIAFPFLSMGVSTSFAAIGLLVAAWSSKDGLVVKMSIWMLLIPAACLLVWLWTQMPISRTSPDSTTQQNTPPSNQQDMLEVMQNSSLSFQPGMEAPMNV